VTSKVGAILMVFADGGMHTLTEITDAANLHTSTTHRLASELVAWRLLERTEERSYRIGLPLRMIGTDYSESDVCSYTLDRDAGPAGAGRTVTSHPQRGATGRSARF
jgi:DNA-binding IclR family transcriptional regulator